MRFFIPTFITLILALLGGCASGSCTTTTECSGGEFCVEGECRPPTRSDGGRDAGSDAAMDFRVLDAPGMDLTMGDMGVDTRTDTGGVDSGDDGGSDVGPDAPAPDAGCVGPTCDGIPEHLWSDVFTGGELTNEIVRGIATDSTGAVIIFGKNSGTLTIGGVTLSTVGFGDLFLAKFTAAGVFRWAHGFGSIEEESGRSITVDASGNIYVTGLYRGPMSFGGVVLPHTAGDTRNLFVASFTPTGSHRWSHGYSNPLFQGGNSVQVAGEHVYVSGLFEGSLTTSMGTLTSAGGRDVFVLHLNRAGVISWQHRYGGNGDEFTQLAAANPSTGGLFLPIEFRSTASFGAQGSRTAAGPQDAALLELSAAGAELRLTTFGQAGTVLQPFGVAAGPVGPVLGLTLRGSLSLGGATISSAMEDGLVVGLAADFSYRWHQTIVSSGVDRIRGLTANADGQVFCTGYVGGVPTIAGITIAGRAGVRNAIVAAFDGMDGSFYWARHWSSTATTEGWGIATSGDRLHVCGSIRTSTNFGGGPIAASGTGTGAISTLRIR